MRGGEGEGIEEEGIEALRHQGIEALSRIDRKMNREWTQMSASKK